QEERQARREREIPDLVQLALVHLRGLELEAVDELRIHQRALQGHLDTGFEAGGPTALLVEAHQRADVLLGVEAAVGAPRERRDDTLGARLLVVRALGIAHEDALAGRRVRRAARPVRTVDPDAADMRIEREAGQTAGL